MPSSGTTTSYKELPITFDKGLVLEIEESLLGQGQASELQNWMPGHAGELRTRNKWRSISTTGITDAAYKCRGFYNIGVQASAVLIQSVSMTITSVTTAQTLNISNVVPGNTLVALFAQPGNSALDIDPPAGWTETVDTGEDHLRVWYKTATGFSDSISIIDAAAGMTSGRLVIAECANIDPTQMVMGTVETTNVGNFDVTVDSTQDAGLAFGLMYSTSSTGTRTISWTTIDADLSGVGSGIAWLQVASVGTQTFTITDTDVTATASGGVAVWFPATNRDSTSFYTVFANAIDDAAYQDYSATQIEYNADATDATSYTGITVTAPAADFIGDIVVAVVATRRTAAPPAAPTSVSGTNAWSGTWTLQGTSVGTNYRISAYTSTIQSAVDGVMTVQFALTQLDFGLEMFYISADDAGGTAVQAVGNAGTGTSRTVTLAAYANAQNFPLMLVADASTVSDTMSAADLTEIVDINSGGNALAIGAYIGVQDSTMAVTGGNVEWVALGLEMPSAHTGTGYRIWKIQRDQLAAGTWEILDERGDCSNNDSIVSFAQGAGALVWSAVTMPFMRAFNLSTEIGADITDVANPGRAVVYHKSRFFSTGATVAPARLYFSDLGSATSWGASNFVDVNADDGETAEDMVSVEGLLLIAKTNSTFLVSGSGIESFFIGQLAGGTAATGRVLARTPYGTILAGPNEVWAVQGGGVDPVSRPLGDSYILAGAASTAYASDKVYILDVSTGSIFVQDLVNGAWATEVVTATDLPYVLGNQGRTLLYGVQNSTTLLGGFRSLSDDRLPDDTGTSVAYRASTPLTFMNGPDFKYTPRHLFLQIRKQDAVVGGDGTLTITVDAGTQSQSFTIEPTDTITRHRKDIAFAQGEPWIQLHFSQDSTAGGSIDVERIIIGVDVEKRR